MAFPFWVLKMVEILRPGAGRPQVHQQRAQGGHLACPSTASRGFNQQKMRLDQENICVTGCVDVVFHGTVWHFPENMEMATENMSVIGLAFKVSISLLELGNDARKWYALWKQCVGRFKLPLSIVWISLVQISICLASQKKWNYPSRHIVQG